MLEPDRYEALTFDCYGTLVDWRGGLLRSLRSTAAAPSFDELRFLDAREREENRIEAGSYLPYRQVVARSVQVAAAGEGLDIDAEQAGAISAGVGAWPPFGDTRDALAVIGRGRRLVIVSNVERRDIEQSVARIGEPFNLIVTAEDVQAYKPGHAHFQMALDRLGLSKERVLHVAQSLYHDIAPAGELGIDSVWINRRGEALPDGLHPQAVFPDMATFAAALGPRST